MMNLTGSHQYQQASQDEEFWMLDGGNVTHVDSFIDNPFSTELKRSRQWFPEELFPRKKQAIEAPISSKLESAGVVNMFSNELSWENEYMTWLYGSERNMPLVTTNDPPFQNNSSVGLSISYNNRVDETENGLHKSSLITTNDPQFQNNSSVGLLISYDNRVDETENGLHKSVEMKHDFGTSGDIISNNKRESNGISFGTYQEIMEALAKPVSSYSLLYEQPLEKKAGIVRGSPTAKNKLEKKLKVAPNSFPTNVKSLTATGMLDGVPVKYISGSRELPAIIQGPGYLCGCQSCNYSKALNAYELEQHAGCKTSHPNNHIRFENGKSIHQVVQELKATPQDMLFDAIRTVTGSPINQKAFHLWKESFQTASRKLQHIYAKEDTNLLQFNPK